MENMRRPMMYTASFIAIAILLFFHLGILEKTVDSAFDNMKGRNIEIKAEVITKEVDYVMSMNGTEQIRTTLKVRLKSVKDISVARGEKLLINFYDYTKAIPGQYVMIRGRVENPHMKRNPGCFDYSLYLKSIGIKYVFDANDISICKQDELGILDRVICTLQMRLYKFRESFITDINKYTDEETAGIVRAIMFGSKTEVDEEILEEFQKNGTAHVLAVSGLHVGLIYGFLSRIWIWKKGRLFFIAIIMFFFAYMIMASFSPSVVRAVIMIWIHAFAKLTNRRYDMPSAAFFTAILMMVANPMHIFNAGFQMSFLAVLTLSLMIPLIKQIYSGIFMASLAVQAGLLPYSIYVFNYISLAAVVVNVPIIYLTGVIVPIGMCSMATMLICEQISVILMKVLSGLCTIMTELNSMTAIDGVTVYEVVSPPLWSVSIYYLILLVFVSEDGRLLFMRKRHVIIKRLAFAVVAISLIFNGVAGNHFKNSDMVFVDVGQGDCMHIRAGNKGDYLVDGGGSVNYNVGKETLKPYLLKNGARSIDGAFVTHLHTDHYKGIAELCREGMVEKLYVYEGYMVRETEMVNETGLRPDQIEYLYAGQKISVDNDVYFEVLWPERRSFREYNLMAANEEDENQFSLILKITTKERSMLVTGDVDTKCLDALAKKYGSALDVDILKAAHHGSKYSDSAAFAEASDPEYVVFQVGKNNFGHPNEGVIEKFRQKGIMIYRNDLDGAVGFEYGKNCIVKARTVRGE